VVHKCLGVTDVNASIDDEIFVSCDLLWMSYNLHIGLAILVVVWIIYTIEVILNDVEFGHSHYNRVVHDLPESEVKAA